MPPPLIETIVLCVTGREQTGARTSRVHSLVWGVSIFRFYEKCMSFAKIWGIIYNKNNCRIIRSDVMLLIMSLKNFYDESIYCNFTRSSIELVWNDQRFLRPWWKFPSTPMTLAGKSLLHHLIQAIYIVNMIKTRKNTADLLSPVNYRHQVVRIHYPWLP